jgi:hypothetical protein
MRTCIDRALIVRITVAFCVSISCLLLCWGGAGALAAGPPTIEGESFSDVGSGSANLSAQINPNGSPTTYYFEYGTSEAYGSRTAEASLGAAEGTLTAPAQLDDLTANSAYHFRVVAGNGAGNEEGPDITFRTLTAGVLGLPDGRVYERVTPVSNENANVYIPSVFKAELSLSEGIFTERPFRAAADGNAVAYVGDPTNGGTGLGGAGLGNSYLATRSSGGGWTQVNIQPPGYYTSRYQAFSSDLSVAFVGSPSGAPGESGFEEGLPALSPRAPAEGYQVLYGRDSSDGSYQPLFTTTASLHRPVKEFGYWKPQDGSPSQPLYAGSSADLSESLFEVNDALTANAVLGGPEENNLYVSVDGQLSLVNVLPDGSSEPNATFGALPLQAPTEGREERLDFGHVISADGSRVFWTDLDTGDLYVREDPTSGNGRTAQVDAAVGGGGRFWTATADGSEVFFTKGDLYAYDVENGQTADLTPGVGVEGVIGASENGEYIYYVDDGNNLEMWHDGGSSYIATLSHEDGWAAGPFLTNDGYHAQGDWQAGLGDRTAEVTPGGQSVVFMSNQSLPVLGDPDGYPNGGMYEVYVYEAEGGRLFCASCNPSGEPPQGNAETGAGHNLTAAFLPISWSAIYQPRVISDEGDRVFFDSAEPLVSQDTNGKQDVYEWELDGAGSCRETDGCIYLLSGGTGSSASWLLDASSSGNDVFIISRTELVPGDPYDSFDVYDARVGGVQPPAAPACSGTGCQGVPPGPPIFATPASVTFDGVGNFPAPSEAAGSGKGMAKAKPLTRAQKLASALKVCRKQLRRKRTSCERRARKRYGAGDGLRKDGKSASKGRK